MNWCISSNSLKCLHPENDVMSLTVERLCWSHLGKGEPFRSLADVRLGMSLCDHVTHHPPSICETVNSRISVSRWCHMRHSCSIDTEVKMPQLDGILKARIFLSLFFNPKCHFLFSQGEKPLQESALTLGTCWKEYQLRGFQSQIHKPITKAGTHASVCVYASEYMCMCICMSMRVSICVYMHTCMCTCSRMWMCVHVCLCVRACEWVGVLNFDTGWLSDCCLHYLSQGLSLDLDVTH